MITMVLDGTLPGGEPKVVEVYACEDIADLSLYALARASNGSAAYETIDAARIFPAVSLSAGDFYYAVGNSFGDQTAVFDSIWPAKGAASRSHNFGANSNGDDVTGLFYDPTGVFPGDFSTVTYIDVFGDLGVDGTGTTWEHLDSYGYSDAFRTPSTTFTESDWTIPNINFLDGKGDPDPTGLDAAIPDATYLKVPEPVGITLVIAGLLGVASMRRRWG